MSPRTMTFGIKLFAINSAGAEGVGIPDTDMLS